MIKPENNTYPILSIQTTYKCNMQCANCYLGDMLNNDEYADVNIDMFENSIKKLPKRIDIRFIGAEPTMNDNLFEMIKIVKKYKHRPQILTNGLKLGQEDYVIKLKESGLNFLGLSMNGGLDDEMYKIFDNGKYAKQKMEALENCFKYNILPHPSNAITYTGEKLHISNIWDKNHINTLDDTQKEYLIAFSGINNVEYSVIDRKNIHDIVEVIKVDFN